jgi:hypothetical protein
MKRSLILWISALGCFGCQSNDRTVAKTPKEEVMTESAIMTAIPRKAESWQGEVIATGLSALSREELFSKLVIVGLSSTASFEWQCRGVRQAFGEKTYYGNPLTKAFLLFGNDDEYVLKVVDCALADQHVDLKNYKVVYVGSRASFDGIVGKLEPTGIVVLTKEYEGERN